MVTYKQFKLFTLYNALNNELDIHCFNANNHHQTPPPPPPNELYYGICENSKCIIFK